MSAFSTEDEPEETTTFAIEDSPLLKQIGTKRMSLTLKKHKPMGCTVEQSLDDDDILLVSSLVEGGNAATAGLRVGDVVVGITGTFGTIVETKGMPIGTLRTLVTSRPEKEVLQLEIVRGSSALANHERALTDLCTNPDASDDQVQEVVTTILQQGYGGDEPDDEIACDDEENCLLDDMHNMWAEELEISDGSQVDSTDTVEDAPSIKPWSVRSSPSGTYVRDPATGELKNIG